MKALIIILALTFCTITPTVLSDSKRVDTGKFDFKSNIGLVSFGKEEQLCLDIKNPNLRNGDNVALVSTNERQAIRHARIIEKVEHSCSNHDINDDEESHYRLEPIKSENPDATPFIAIIKNKASFSLKNKRIYTDLDGDGKPEHFKSCFSMEGMHFTVWTGQGKQEKRRWHRYYYLGYDMEGNCTEKEVKE